MHLTRDEELMYNGERGPDVQKSMEIVVALGEIYHAEGLVKIKSAQISGVSYKTIGNAGLEYLEDMARTAEVKVPSTLNPAGLDLKNWHDLGFSREFMEKQLRIVEAYRKMGISTTCTCTPYLVGNVPRLGDHISWSESSAVCYANSVLGARTNREGGPGALAAAICGKTAAYGYHLVEGRKADYLIVMENRLNGSDYGALGYLIGKIVGDGVPYFKFQTPPSTDDLKSLGAALASSGAVALYHVEQVTPEYKEAFIDVDMSQIEKITVNKNEIEDIRLNLSTTDKNADLVCLGCPHASLEEIKTIADKLVGRKLKNKLWICTSLHIKEAADMRGYTNTIEKAGGKVICDTCMVVAPIEELGYDVLGVDSAKAANYVPSMCGMDVIYDDWEKLVVLED